MLLKRVPVNGDDESSGDREAEMRRAMAPRRIGRCSWRLETDDSGAPVTLEVIRLDGSLWRISGFAPGRAETVALRGYVERLDRDRFEVLWFPAPLGWAYVSTFEAALTAISDRSKYMGPIGEARAVPLRRSTAAHLSGTSFSEIFSVMMARIFRKPPNGRIGASRG